MSDYRKPLPRIGPDTQPFWDGAKQNRLRLPFCEACGKPHWPAGPICPFCLADRLAWRDASGRGRISTFTIVHKAWFPAFRDNIPYNVVQVELEEGPRVTANLVGGNPAIGMDVEAIFDPVSPELTLLRFRPAGGKA